MVAAIDGMRFIVPGGRPGDRITGRPIRSGAHLLGLPIATPLDRVLRRPTESAEAVLDHGRRAPIAVGLPTLLEAVNRVWAAVRPIARPRRAILSSTTAQWLAKPIHDHRPPRAPASSNG
jgi:hypothetical protein